MNITLPETPWNTKPTPPREHTQPQPERRLSSGQFGILPRSAKVLISRPPKRDAMQGREADLLAKALAYRVNICEGLSHRAREAERVAIVRGFGLSISAVSRVFKVSRPEAMACIEKAAEAGK